VKVPNEAVGQVIRIDVLVTAAQLPASPPVRCEDSVSESNWYPVGQPKALGSLTFTKSVSWGGGPMPHCFVALVVPHGSEQTAFAKKLVSRQSSPLQATASRRPVGGLKPEHC
jgi:hypothetical protein